MNRLLALAAIPFLLSLPFANAEDTPPPNVLFCIADDWGWPHAGAYASTEGDEVVKTPHPPAPPRATPSSPDNTTGG